MSASRPCLVTPPERLASLRSRSPVPLGALAIAAALLAQPVLAIPVPLAGVADLAAGNQHACARLSNGKVKCWGTNTYGQLGDGTTTTRFMPVDVVGVMNATAVANGGYHSCALLADSTVRCWGANDQGQLGDGTNLNRPVAVSPSGLAGATRIAAGQYHTCVILTGGGLKCWGRNSEGQIGDNTTMQRALPTDVWWLLGATALSAHGNTSCAVVAGGLNCWGWNSQGQVGEGTLSNRLVPTGVSGLSSGVAAVGGGYLHTCAITTGGAAKCWGDNDYGQVGDGTTTDRYSPAPVSGLASGVAAIEGGQYHTCALTTGGGVKCWGDGAYYKLGNASVTPRTAPVDVTGLASGAVQVAPGWDYSCARTTAGGVQCWGHDANGSLGDNYAQARSAPVAVPELSAGTLSVAAGLYHACAITAAGGVKCWGDNSVGQLGIGTNAWTVHPTDVTGLASGVVALAAGSYHTCALTTAGAMKCWGSNGAGQLGDDSTTTRYAPAPVSGLASGVTAIAAHYAHTCAVVAGAVKCWGNNEHGQLGDGTTTNQRVPVNVSGLTSGATAVAAGAGHSCALVGGNALCWGWNVVGQLGDGSTTDHPTPAAVSSLPAGSVAIDAGDFHTCAVTAAGAMKCWGDGTSGQLGDNDTQSRTLPIDVSGLSSGVAAISLGDSHSCARTSAGAAKCWGNGTWGRLGDNTGATRLVPTDVLGLSSGVTGIAAGYAHSCAVAGGELWCWGYDEYGQVGDGTAVYQTAPVDVLAPNAAPVITEGASVGVTMSEDGAPTAFSLTLHASDPDGDALAWSIGAQGAHGTAGVAPPAGASTTLTYSPEADYNGSDAFLVTVNDGHQAVTITVNVTVTPVNDPPASDAVASPAPVPENAGPQAVTVTGISPGPANESAQAVGASITGVGDPGLFAAGPTVTGSGATRTISYAPARAGSSTVTVKLQDDGGTAGGGADSLTHTFTVTFKPVWQLTVARAGGGGGRVVSTSPAFPSINCGPICIGTFEDGTAVTLVASPSANSRFTGWTGCVSPAANVCTVTMGAAASVTANFALSGGIATDFTWDGKPDLLWRQLATGATYVWYMNGTALASDRFLATIDPSWTIVGTGDFNGDGYADVIWRNVTTGVAYVWYLIDGVFQTDAYLFTIDPTWRIAAVADFNGDGKPDLLMWNATTGVAFVWYFDNTTPIGDGFLFSIDTRWIVEAVGDFDLDGRPDLLFRSLDSGLAFAWRTTYSGGVTGLGTSTPPLFSIDPVWQVVQVADWDGDGKPDLLFRNAATGLVFVWYLDGTTLGRSDFVFQIDPSWEIVPRR